MKAKLNVLINVPDDFECGDCKNCPIHQENYINSYQCRESKISCPLGFNHISCPIEVVCEMNVTRRLKQESD